MLLSSHTEPPVADEPRTERSHAPGQWIQAQGVIVSRVQWRAVVGVAAAVIAGGCSTLGGSAGTTAATPFCVEAQKVASAGLALTQSSDGNPGATRDAWTSLMVGAKGLQRIAPADLSTDYTVYVGWLDNFGAALARHGYKLGDSVTDEQFVSSTAEQRFVDARQKVDAYLDTTCHVSSALADNSSSSAQATTSSTPSAASK